ncbi:MAG: hypothetical protein WCI74_19590, partial [Actinomycetes bacterium]
TSLVGCSNNIRERPVKRMSNAVATGQLDSPRTMRPTPIRLVGLGVFTCLLYVALAILGREAILPAVGVSLFWPPTAFGLAMVARFRGPWLAAVIRLFGYERGLAVLTGKAQEL